MKEDPTIKCPKRKKTYSITTGIVFFITLLKTSTVKYKEFSHDVLYKHMEKKKI